MRKLTDLIKKEKTAVDSFINKLKAKKNEPIKLHEPYESVVLAIDTSGSMSDHFDQKQKIESAKKAIEVILRSSDKEKTDYTVVQFEMDAKEIHDGFSNRYGSVLRSTKSLTPGGGTDIREAIRESLVRLLGSQGKSRIILLTDGRSCNNNPVVIQEARVAAEQNVIIDTVGFGNSYGIDEELLKEIARITNGKYIKADSTKALMDGFKALETRFRFMLTVGTPLGSGE